MLPGSAFIAGWFSECGSLLGNAAAKGSAVLGVGAIVALVAGEASAAFRHLLWQVAVVALLLVPVLTVVLPEWRVLPRVGFSVVDPVGVAPASMLVAPTDRQWHGRIQDRGSAVGCYLLPAPLVRRARRHPI